MKKKEGFVHGLVTGVILMLCLYFFSFGKKESKQFKYVQLKEDYKIEDIGNLKRGTILRIDQAMPEGFTRYILYLNLKGDRTEAYKSEYSDEIIPYWLQPSVAHK